MVFLMGDTLDHGIRQFLEQTGAMSVSRSFDLNDLLQAIGRILAATERG
jgi:hypothetical protein